MKFNLFKRKKKREIDKVFKSLEQKRNLFFNHRYQKFIVSYEFEDDQIKVYSNIGNYRKVNNTRSNLSKINKAIVKNKIAIINKIDDYEKNFKERLIILLGNLLLVCGTGACIPLSFFTGSYTLLLFACITFSITVVTASVSGIDYYVLAKEIQNLKAITGYKKENEFRLPNINVGSLKK